jgi:hypothetical protein
MYEPRSLWSIANVPQSNSPRRIRMRREDFRNGERHPIQVDRVAIAPINYTFMSEPAGAPNPNQSCSILNRAKLIISAPQKQHYGMKPMVLSSLAPEPRYTPQANRGVADPGLLSSLYGICMLRFDKELVIPFNGQIQSALSVIGSYGVGQIPNLDTHSLFLECGDNTTRSFAGIGSARSHRFGMQQLEVTAGTREIPRDPRVGWPYPQDSYANADSGGEPNFWDGAGNFSGRLFRQQESSRAGSTRVIAFHTLINQFVLDAALISAEGGGQPTPAALRVGCRMKTVACGSGANFWREGAPLGLVCDTITPAAVYKLPTPITLGPGDVLDVELELPGTAGEFVGDAELDWHVGVSFNGFAAIQG